MSVAHPAVSLAVLEGTSAALLGRLPNDEIDVAVISTWRTITTPPPVTVFLDCLNGELSAHFGTQIRRYCAGVDDDRFPAETEPMISEDLRQRGIDVLQGLLASGKVDLDRFHTALDGLLGARTHAEFASVVRSLPPPVAFTPAARRRHEPLKISASISDVRLKGRWQAGRLTKISTGVGAVTIDLTEAEFDDWDVEIVVDTGMGSITVIAPRGLDVRQVRRSGAVKSTLEEPIPGYPVVRLSASCGNGTIRLMHAKEKRQRRWGWRRRRS